MECSLTRMIVVRLVITVGSSRIIDSSTSANSEVVTTVVTPYFSIWVLYQRRKRILLNLRR